MDKNDDFFAQLLATFRLEAEEHLNAMSAGLLALEKKPAPEERKSLLETVYRAAHSLKGASRAVDLTDVEALCQAAESVFAAIKRDELELTSELFDTLLRVLDALNTLLAGPAVRPEQLITSLLQEMAQLKEGSAAQQPAPVVSEVTPHSELPTPQSALRTPQSQIRIAVDRLDTVLRETEEMLAAKLTLQQHTGDIQQVARRFRQLEMAWDTLSPLLRQAGQALEEHAAGAATASKLRELLAWQQNEVKTLASELMSLARSSENDARDIGSMVDDLLLDTKKLLMLPCSTLLRGFPKMVRDLARDLGKEVEFVSEGAEVELDKRILEGLKDPLVHLLRNSLDHGIEAPEVRQERNKPRQGSMKITVAQVDSSNVEILVTDDGAGIDLERVKEAAVKSQLLSPEDAQGLDTPALLRYIFHSGVSTSVIITDISGRGLGMAIVREHVEGLGGSVALDTSPGVGTSFRIVVPVTHATFRGVLVQVADHSFIVPTAQIERVWRLKITDVVTVENRETLALNGQAISLVHLADVLAIPRVLETATPEFIQVVVVCAAGKRIALLVDNILREQEVLVKPLGRQLARVRNIAGATVLGSGEVVPILNIRDLLKSAGTAGQRREAIAPIFYEEPRAQQSILVVEDSVTSRMLLKNILEAKGYRVSVAVDGLDGFTTLKTDPVDLVVSDIEMPRMDGFALTAKIRGDAKLADLPVILVTALESREHRERGIDVGANAYIVKSSFDQSVLLETIERLI